MEWDPVCKMEVDGEQALWTSEHNGRTYYFCAHACKLEFDKDPELFSSDE